MEIPIQNLYYLLLYAWDRLEEGQVVQVEDLGQKEVADLLARVLESGTRRVLKRGLDRSYADREEATARLRGRILFSPSIRRILLPQARAVCRFDELTPDVLTNQILRTTLGRLSRVETLDESNRQKLRLLHRQMDGVREVAVTKSSFQQVRYHANNAFYRFLLNVCALVHENLFMEKRGGGYKFRDFVRDEVQMAALFEKFLFNFYLRECADYSVKRDILRWEAVAELVRGPGRLPVMKTDVTLRTRERTLVIDAKYYREALVSGQGVPAFRSSHLYQMFAYLKNMERNGGADARADGLLLYPAVQDGFDHVYRLGNHRLRLATVDLGQTWSRIHETLLALTEPVSSASEVG